MLRKFGNSAIDVDDVLSVKLGSGSGSATVHLKSLAGGPSYLNMPNDDARILVDWIDQQAKQADLRKKPVPL
jgi:hypothetical protein